MMVPLQALLDLQPIGARLTWWTLLDLQALLDLHKVHVAHGVTKGTLQTLLPTQHMEWTTLGTYGT